MTVLPTAVVTGANSGIGLETVRGLAREGMHVVMVLQASSPPRSHIGPS